MKKEPTPQAVQARALRQQEGLTQKQCSELVGVEPRTWERYESGKIGMTSTICDYFKIRLALKKLSIEPAELLKDAGIQSSSSR